ncbi:MULTISPECIES: glutathione S-transferase family protein [Salinivibrio]|uniref:Glutathione S-transferase family protein n=1 Tax=Salinivibrio costicola TaxID=51367 RepID=A0ABX6K8B1_SALCS|nr:MULTISPECIES: glutathione S-transferase family protein [Salinivibrio]QIR07766.1 glutathione S-transferase family protein [Salinivibrio costicola]
MMKIYGHPSAINVQKVMWLIDELDLSIELDEVDIHHNAQDADALAQKCPMRQVPVLEDGPNSVWESHTILRYLVACYGNKMWYPDCAFQRSRYERWMDWCLSSFQPAVKTACLEASSDLKVREAALEQCRQDLEKLDNELAERRYLISDMMTLADIAIGTVVHSLAVAPSMTLPPHVSQWYQQLKSSSGYQRWVVQARQTQPA